MKKRGKWRFRVKPTRTTRRPVEEMDRTELLNELCTDLDISVQRKFDLIDEIIKRIKI